MIADTVLFSVLEQVAQQPNVLSDVLVGQLRKAFAGIHFSICSDDDIPARLTPAAGNSVCNLYYVASGDHCLSLTNDPDAATGLVVALCDGDE